MRAFVLLSICCICDDFSSNPSERCESDMCDTSHILCDICETKRKFVGRTWYTTRTCSSETQCAKDWYHTLTTVECIDNTRGEPADGTTCYKCCKVQDPRQPFYCVDNPDTNYVNLSVTLPTTVATKTTPTTTHRSTTTTTTTTTTPSPTTPTPTSKAVTCETCLSNNCTNTRTITCGAGEDYCMNTLISDGVTSTIKKACASKTECYYDSYLAMKYKPECTGATGNTAQQPFVCHYCCEAQDGHSPACNTDLVPKYQAVFDNSGNQSGVLCEVGRDNNYQTTRCSDLTPFCMNTVILGTNITIVKKTCESEALCNQDWWDLTRNRKQCMHTNFSMLPVLDDGLVCHYCCKSRDGQPCNTETIPYEAQDIIAKSVDGGWSDWSAWTGCSEFCTGIQVRNRRCDNPVPGQNGDNCHGQASEQEDCKSDINCHITATGSQALIG